MGLEPFAAAMVKSSHLTTLPFVVEIVLEAKHNLEVAALVIVKFE